MSRNYYSIRIESNRVAGTTVEVAGRKSILPYWIGDLRRADACDIRMAVGACLYGRRATPQMAREITSAICAAERKAHKDSFRASKGVDLSGVAIY